MPENGLRFRQVHLDFHTSPEIYGVGREFNAGEFADTLQKANVNSVTCFARCHHGMLYYASEQFPERIHPHLENKNLLKEIIEACHKRNIRVPVYITVQWDAFTAEEHPEWLVIEKTGRQAGTPPHEAGFYRVLCVNSPYRDFLKNFTKEVLDAFPVDGLFFDIVYPIDCSCKYCRAGMKAKGLDAGSDEVRMRYARELMDEFKLDMTRFVRQYNKECTVFYNSSHIGTVQRPAIAAYSHFELESLPSGGWGYMHFPVTMRYARNLGPDCLAQTGKFHTEWGDFHSFKNKEALEYECFRMLALNAKCMTGDQLEPKGRLSEPVYELIGGVYSQVMKKEPWCKNARALTDIGVFTPEEFTAYNGELHPAILGVTRMLEESGHQFDIIDSFSDISRYKVLVMPDAIPVNEEFAEKLNNYIINGGKIIATYEAGLNSEKTGFALDAFNLKPVGQAPYSPDFIVPLGDIGKGLPETEHVMYLKGLEVEAVNGAQVLAQTVIPYFNRTWEHFCSHRHTPSSGISGYPGIVKSNGIIYFMHPIFTQYNQNAPKWCKQLFRNALEMLLPEPLIKHDGPSTLLVTVNEQPAENRWVIHLLHYIPERRCREIDIVEDVIPLYNIKLSVRVPSKITGAALVPENIPLTFSLCGDRLEISVPEIRGHQMVAIGLQSLC